MISWNVLPSTSLTNTWKTIPNMIKVIFLTVAYSYCHYCTGSVFHSVCVVDNKTGHAMERAGVRLLNPVDSMLITGQTTDSTGRFMLRDIKPGKYILNVTTVGYNDYYQNLTVADKDLQIDKIVMQEDAHMLQQVNVTGTAVQVVVKNDTIEYNAQAFKTAQKCSGGGIAQKNAGCVSPEGKITVNGQK